MSVTRLSDVSLNRRIHQLPKIEHLGTPRDSLFLSIHVQRHRVLDARLVLTTLTGNNSRTYGAAGVVNVTVDTCNTGRTCTKVLNSGVLRRTFTFPYKVSGRTLVIQGGDVTVNLGKAICRHLSLSQSLKDCVRKRDARIPLLSVRLRTSGSTSDMTGVSGIAHSSQLGTTLGLNSALAKRRTTHIMSQIGTTSKNRRQVRAAHIQSLSRGTRNYGALTINQHNNEGSVTTHVTGNGNSVLRRTRTIRTLSRSLSLRRNINDTIPLRFSRTLKVLRGALSIKAINTVRQGTAATHSRTSSIITHRKITTVDRASR